MLPPSSTSRQRSLGGLGANSTAGLIRRIRDLGLEVPPGAGPTQLRAILEDHADHADPAAPPRRHPRQGWQLDNRQLSQGAMAHLPRSPSSPSRPGSHGAMDLRARLAELGFEIPSNVVDRGELEKLVKEAERQRGHNGKRPGELTVDLPVPWERCESRSKPGHFYFVNRATGERTWEPWFQHESRSSPGRFYYINVLTSDSVWDPPTRRWRELVQERLLPPVADEPPPPPPPPPEDPVISVQDVQEVEIEPDPPAPAAADYRDNAFTDGVAPEDELPRRKLSTASVLSCTHGSKGVRKISVAGDQWDQWFVAGNVPSPTSQARQTCGQELTWIRGPLIGRGSLGHVFKAVEMEDGQSTGRILAVKEVLINSSDRRDAKFRESLENEVNIMKALKHPHIVEYLGHDYLDECLYLYLEHVPGGSITQALNDFGAFAESLMASYARQTLEGLEYLHTREPAVIHRDIKGSNILIGDGDTVKLADFGCSKRTDETLTHTMRGSIPWMAPEVLAHSRYGRAADLWSFGCVVIEMGTANVPWGRFEHQMAALVKIGLSQETPPLPEQVSGECKDFLNQCIRRDPAERLSATEMLQHVWLNTLFDDWDDT